MKKPSSMWEFLGKLFVLLGVVFLLTEILTQKGVMKMEPTSQGSPVVFAVAAGCFLVIGIPSLFVAARKEKRTGLLLQSGRPVQGVVTSVKQLSYTRWGTLYPYVVRFQYEWEGARFEGKSRLIWTLPPVGEHDPLTVFIDEDFPKRCAVKL